MRSQYRPMASMIWSAVLVHLKGLALTLDFRILLVQMYDALVEQLGSVQAF
jgi:hypothetical protein